jgi:hypothetical protein
VSIVVKDSKSDSLITIRDKTNDRLLLSRIVRNVRGELPEGVINQMINSAQSELGVDPVNISWKVDSDWYRYQPVPTST